MTALTNAVLPILATDGVPVGVGKRPTVDGTKPYIVIWPDAAVRSAVTMKANDGATETWVCHCLGLTPDSVDVAVRKLTTAVYGLYRTVVDGRRVHYPEQLAALPLTRDDDVNPPLYDLTVEWRLSTTPA